MELSMENLHEITVTRNKARPECGARRNHSHGCRPRRNPCVQASIAVSRYGDSFNVAFVIYRAGQPVEYDFILLPPGECLNEQRAWLVGYSRICEWAEARFADAGVFIVEPSAKARRAA